MARSLVEDGQALLEDGAAGERKAVLRQVADAHAAGPLHVAVVERSRPARTFMQRGFAGAVGADQRGLLVRRDQPVGVLEKEFRAKSLARVGELQHESILAGGEDREVNGWEREWWLLQRAWFSSPAFWRAF